MRGLMMDFPLTIAPILERAGNTFSRVEIVSRKPDRTLSRSTWGNLYARSRRLANALTGLGLQRGDRVATLLWNQTEHMEAYFGVPVSGGVLHTLNVRLHPDELAFIANHAQDRFLIVDDVLLPIFAQFRARVKFERVIVVPYGGCEIPATYDNYEALLAAASEDFTYPLLDENEAAAMCYTSGTTGRPKGVVYSHRAIVLHSLVCSMPDHFNISNRDTILPIVSMYHVNAWGLPYSGVLNGSKQVLPGINLQPHALLDLMQEEQVTLTAGVPTIWMGVLDALDKNPGRWNLSSALRLSL